jgi:hypothetical protein
VVGSKGDRRVEKIRRRRRRREEFVRFGAFGRGGGARVKERRGGEGQRGRE